MGNIKPYLGSFLQALIYHSLTHDARAHTFRQFVFRVAVFALGTIGAEPKEVVLAGYLLCVSVSAAGSCL
jgi:hypothetical protein